MLRIFHYLKREKNQKHATKNQRLPLKDLYASSHDIPISIDPCKIFGNISLQSNQANPIEPGLVHPLMLVACRQQLTSSLRYH